MKKIDPFYAAIGERIRNLRLERNWTQDYLARQIGLSGGWLTGVEHGKCATPMHRFVQLAAVLKVDPKVLTGMDEDEIKAPIITKANRNGIKPEDSEKPIDQQVIEAAMALHGCLEKGYMPDINQAIVVLRQICDKKKNHLNYLEAGGILLEAYKDK